MKLSKQRNRSALLASIGIALAMAGGQAAATGVHCHRIDARGEQPIYQEPCEADPAFFACILGTTKGTLRSDWGSFFTAVPVELTNPPFHLPVEADTTLFQADFERLKTRRGEIRGYATYLMDLRMFDAGGFTFTTYVTGGTGIYEDATGWIVGTATDGTLINFVLRGKVCGPNIPRGINGDGND